MASGIIDKSEVIFQLSTLKTLMQSERGVCVCVGGWGGGG